MARLRRLLEAAAFVGIWIALGLKFHLSPNAYLLAGIPLTVLFQFYVSKRPLTALWVREAPAFRLSRCGYALVAGLMIVPLIFLFRVIHTSPAPDKLLVLCSIIACMSALPAAYAFQNFCKSTWKNLALCFATAGVISVLMLLAIHHFSKTAPPLHAFKALKSGIQWFLFYLVFCFAVEECSFRGLLDAHVHHPGERHGVWTALFVSALWGVWHYPVVKHGSHPVVMILGLIATQSVVGVPLSLFWRRSSNLGVPVAVHAFADALRNAMGFFPH